MTEKQFVFIKCIENNWGIIERTLEDTDQLILVLRSKTTVKYIFDLLNSLSDENEQLKQQIKDLQAKNDSIEWLRNNTTWEQIPSIIRTSISTNTVENPYCDKRKVNKR